MGRRNTFENLAARRITRVHNNSIAARICANHLELRAASALCFLPAKFEALTLVFGLIAASLFHTFGFGDAAHLFALSGERGLPGGLGFALGLEAGRQVVKKATAIGKDAPAECYAGVFLLGRRPRKFTGGSLA